MLTIHSRRTHTSFLVTLTCNSVNNITTIIINIIIVIPLRYVEDCRFWASYSLSSSRAREVAWTGMWQSALHSP